MEPHVAVAINDDLAQAVTRALASWSNPRRPMLLSELYYKAKPFLADPTSWPGPPVKAKDWVRSISGVVVLFSETFTDYTLALEPLTTADAVRADGPDSPAAAYSSSEAVGAPPLASTLELLRATSVPDTARPFRIAILLRANPGIELPDGAANDVAASSARLRWVVQMSKMGETDWESEAAPPRCIGNSCVQFHASEALAAEIARRAGDKWRSWYGKFTFAITVRDSRLLDDADGGRGADAAGGGSSDNTSEEGGTGGGGPEAPAATAPPSVVATAEATVLPPPTPAPAAAAAAHLGVAGLESPPPPSPAATAVAAVDAFDRDASRSLTQPQQQHAAEVITLWDVENVPVPAGVGSLMQLKAALEVELAKMGYMARVGGHTQHQLVMATASTGLFASLTRLNLGVRPEDVKLVLSRPKPEAADHDLRTEMLEALQRRRDLQARRVMAAATALALSSPWHQQQAAALSAEVAIGQTSAGSWDQHRLHQGLLPPPPLLDAREELYRAHVSGRLLVCIVTKDADFLAHVSADGAVFLWSVPFYVSLHFPQVNDVLRFGQKAVVCVPVPLNPDAPRLQLELAVAARRFYENAPGGGSVHIMEWRSLMQALAHLLGAPRGGR